MPEEGKQYQGPIDVVLSVISKNLTIDAGAAETNSFMTNVGSSYGVEATAETFRFHHDMREAGARVISIMGQGHNKDGEPVGDEIFPNNLYTIAKDGDGKLVFTIHPVSPSRQKERREDVIAAGKEFVESQGGYVFDMREQEKGGKYLEGTGVLILNRDVREGQEQSDRVAFATISPRANREMIELWTEKMGYKAVIGETIPDEVKGEPVYHTNVIMSVGKDRVYLGIDNLKPEYVSTFSQEIVKLGKKLVPLTKDQIDAFAGNNLELIGEGGKIIHIFPETGAESLTGQQVNSTLETADAIVHSPMDYVQDAGGSSRCLMCRFRFDNVEQALAFEQAVRGNIKGVVANAHDIQQLTGMKLEDLYQHMAKSESPLITDSDQIAFVEGNPNLSAGKEIS